MRLTQNILKQVVTEKSTKQLEKGIYVFETDLSARAGLVKKELKKMYDVDVINIRSLILPGKKRRKGKTAHFKKTAKRKKFMVVLKAGQKIEGQAK